MFLCPCLNVSITVNPAVVRPLALSGSLLTSQGLAEKVLSSPNGKIQSDWNGLVISLEDLKLSEDERCDPFFQGEESFLKLPLEETKISEKIPFLVEQRFVGGRRSVFRCLLCDTATHGVSQETQTMLVKRKNMITDESAISQLCGSANYSSVFGVLLPKDCCLNAGTVSTNTGTILGGISLYNRKAMQYIQAQVDQYLSKEEEAMEERIRNFAEQEAQKFHDIKQCVKQQKSSVLNIIMQHTAELKVSYDDENDSAVPLSPLSLGTSSGNVSPGFNAWNSGTVSDQLQFDNTGAVTGITPNQIISLPGTESHVATASAYGEHAVHRPKAYSNPPSLQNYKRRRPGDVARWREETVFSLDEQDDELNTQEDSFDGTDEDFESENNMGATNEQEDVGIVFNAAKSWVPSMSLPVKVIKPWIHEGFQDNKENDDATPSQIMATNAEHFDEPPNNITEESFQVIARYLRPPELFGGRPNRRIRHPTAEVFRAQELQL